MHNEMYDEQKVFDLIGVGIGPFNLGLASLLTKVPDKKVKFFEKKPRFDWHPGMLLEGTTLQVPFFADLVTMADPTHPLSFLNYLQERGRLYHFYFLENFHIPRREYNDYCQWSAEKLPSCRFGAEVTKIELVQLDNESAYKINVLMENGNEQLYYSRHIVLGVGNGPHIPDAFTNLKSKNVFHSADFKNNIDQCKEAKSISIIGSGQSAAEIFQHLLKEQNTYRNKLSWFTRSKGFFPMEYSKLGLEHFSPDYINYFYHLPQERKDEIRIRQDLLYKGISAKTIAEIYDALYEASIGDQRPDVKLLASTEVVGVKENKNSFILSCHHLEQSVDFEHESDVLILATGYAPRIPTCIDPLKKLISWDSMGRFDITRDYQVKLSAGINNCFYIQNGELHSHGIGAPDLGLGAHRNSVIINHLVGRSVYPVRSLNVFQQFGVNESSFIFG